VTRHPSSAAWRTGRASISKSGRRLATTLGNQRRYTLAPDGKGQDKPIDFFQGCYSMRSNLVHGEGERPSYTDVSHRGANLEVFVADLLSGARAGRSTR
jgi:hypothetical protein